jgi:hypothetical protein
MGTRCDTMQKLAVVMQKDCSAISELKDEFQFCLLDHNQTSAEEVSDGI